MTSAGSQCKINAIEVGELSFAGIGSPTPVLSCKYALTQAETGIRYGAGNRNTNWSDRTYELLQLLLGSMERDIIRDVFNEGATVGGIESELDAATDSVPSL